MATVSEILEKANIGDIKAIRELAVAYMKGNGVE